MAIFLIVFISHIGLMFEHKWDENWKVIKTETRKNDTFSYLISISGLLMRFVVPTILLIIFSSQVIGKVTIS